MYATAEIDRGQTRQALFIPEGAVQELNGARVVFIRTAVNQFEPRPVETARILNGSMEVTSGLKPGDQIVVKGSFILKSQLLKSSLEEE
jgi:multidrug efflux pump subunit AcrA (membrane-fusion protein)